MDNRQILDVKDFGARLDWLTVTTPECPDEAEHFRQFAWNYMQRERERWGDDKVTSLAGYDGAKCADTFFGSRQYDGNEMLVCSGEHSNRLAEEMIIHEVPGRVRRIDGRVLARTDSPSFDYPEHLRQAIISAGEQKGSKRRKKVNLFGSARGSDGATVGARSSEKYVRIYDHDAKHNKRASGLLWAHEAEFKATSAQLFFDGYKKAPSRGHYVAGVVRNTLQSMNIPCEWLRDIEAISVVVGRKLTTDDKRLAYCEKITVPMLEKLVSSGKGDEVRALLIKHGLDKLF